VRRLTHHVGTTLDGSVAGPVGEFDSFPVSADHAAFAATGSTTFDSGAVVLSCARPR
jgi:hypothetical protein